MVGGFSHSRGELHRLAEEEFFAAIGSHDDRISLLHLDLVEDRGAAQL